MTGQFDIANAMPADWRGGTFLGRLESAEGPIPVMIRSGDVFDMSGVAPTVSQLIEDALTGAVGALLGGLEKMVANHAVLSPIDLQCVKAAGVTFAVSALERVIEERARGDMGAAAAVRTKLEARVGSGIRSVVPGTPEAAQLKQALLDEGMWSQYLEVAIGPDAEIFTKAPVLSTVGWGADVGVRSDSGWNNPEPEVVLLVDSRGKSVGAMLGNDVNLRDFEGRSALLLGKAKDNNASCSLGPFVRLFDDGFSMDDVRDAQLDLTITGPEGYVLEGHSSMREISRDPEELVRQAFSQHHYPDGIVLMLGTLFAPVQDRDAPGHGFTHKPGDTVTIASARLGALANRVVHCGNAPPWTFGVGALMQNLAARGLLNSVGD